MEPDAVARAKRAAAIAGVGLVKPGTLVALGTGSTADLAIRILAERFPDGGNLVTVGSSRGTESLARSLGFRIEPLGPGAEFDLMIDGADEVSDDLALIKGGGGALFREKLLARATREVVILVDESKLVHRLGEKHPIPVEVVPFARVWVAHVLTQSGYRVAVRHPPTGSTPYLTDNGNEVLDLTPPQPLADPAETERELRGIPGIVECGIFVHLAHRVLIGKSDGSVVERVPKPE
ncbi:MAG TPA: ribose-5-phosphate isomerase RpiA [Thermoplasmata archaeon]|nr:ribose-5-phosphate isomerase RpiA [Thermoplasmata archaeon]